MWKDYTSAMKFSNILFLAVFLVALPVRAADAVYEVNQLIKKGKKEQALEQVDAYLAAQRKDAWGRNITQMRFTKGVLLADLHRNDEAIQVFSKLTQDYPDLPEPYNNLAALYAARGNNEEAQDTLERGLRTDPAYATAYRNLNEINARIASSAYDHVVKASSGGKPAPELIKELCDNYGRMAKQSVGSKHMAGDVSLIRDIPKNRASAGSAPSKIDIDEMAVESTPAASALPPAFVNPAVNPAPTVPSVVVSAKPAAQTKLQEASKSTVETQSAKPAAEAEKAVIVAVNGWASSWSHKNVSAYLAAYSSDFRPPSSQSRSEWAKQRKERIGKPKSIRVSIDAPKVTMVNATHATVSFHQGYRSDDLQTTTRKLLLMVKKGNKWLIQEERVGG
jgi:tetratricopeptide (TPR) repeat protein